MLMQKMFMSIILGGVGDTKVSLKIPMYMFGFESVEVFRAPLLGSPKSQKKSAPAGLVLLLLKVMVKPSQVK